MGATSVHSRRNKLLHQPSNVGGVTHLKFFQFLGDQLNVSKDTKGLNYISQQSPLHLELLQQVPPSLTDVLFSEKHKQA